MVGLRRRLMCRTAECTGEQGRWYVKVKLGQRNRPHRRGRVYTAAQVTRVGRVGDNNRSRRYGPHPPPAHVAFPQLVQHRDRLIYLLRVAPLRPRHRPRAHRRRRDDPRARPDQPGAARACRAPRARAPLALRRRIAFAAFLLCDAVCGREARPPPNFGRQRACSAAISV